MISWILSNLGIGGYTDVINIQLLLKEKVDCVLNISAKPINYEVNTSGIKFYHVKVFDDDDEVMKLEFEVASYMLDKLLKKYNKVVVNCMAGIDRSPFLVATQLIKMKKVFSYGEAYYKIKQVRPSIREHYEWKTLNMNVV